MKVGVYRITEFKSQYGVNAYQNLDLRQEGTSANNSLISVQKVDVLI